MIDPVVEKPDGYAARCGVAKDADFFTQLTQRIPIHLQHFLCRPAQKQVDMIECQHQVKAFRDKVTGSGYRPCQAPACVLS